MNSSERLLRKRLDVLTRLLQDERRESDRRVDRLYRELVKHDNKIVKLEDELERVRHGKEK